jgi:hypothetical protein
MLRLAAPISSRRWSVSCSRATLLEQMLAAHPQLHACGENALLSDALAACAWSAQQCRAVGEAYLQRLRSSDCDALRFTDKTLTHLTRIGVIARLLPAAKIIHLRRSALDTCLSIYRNNITGELFDYGHDMGELGRYHRMYERLMAHWRSVLPAGMLIEIDYEQLVADSEATLRTLLEACGLSWDPACLEFRRADNRVQTASMTQVRQPLYTRSVGAAAAVRRAGGNGCDVIRCASYALGFS